MAISSEIRTPVRIRDLTLDDVPALASGLVRAYGDAKNTPDALAARLRASFACETKSFIADDGGALVGMVLVYDYGTTCFVALMGVEPSRQRSGVGKAIMAAMCEWLDRTRAQLPAELYSTPQGLGLYLQHGFVVDGTAGIWYGHGQAGGDVAGVARATAADHDAIAALDRDAFGADRGASFRAALEHPASSVFIAEGGFAIAQRAAKVLGPVVARDRDTALRLLRAAAGALDDGEHRVNAPVRDDVEALLHELGYRRERTAERMVRGTVPGGARGHIWAALNLGQG
jgi:GNAT superfamily N-acetyltransferase